MARSRLFIDLPADLARAARVEAARRGVTISSVAAEALETALGLSRDREERRRKAASVTREIARSSARLGSRGVSTDDLVTRERP